MANTITLRAYLNDLSDMIEAKSTAKVIPHCRYILQHFPQNIATYRLLAIALVDRGEREGVAAHYDEALEIFQRVLSVVPLDFRAHRDISRIRVLKSQITQAIWHLERAYEQKPSDQTVQEELRQLYAQRSGAPVQGKLQLTRAALARQYINGMLFDQALIELRAALHETPARVDLQLLLAETMWETQHPIEAGEIAVAILKKLPYCLPANRILARLWLQHERPNDAQVFLDRIAAVDPYAARQILRPDSDAPDPNILQQLNVDLYSDAEQSGESPTWLDELGDTGEAFGDLGPGPFDMGAIPFDAEASIGEEAAASPFVGAKGDWAADTADEPEADFSDWLSEIPGADDTAEPTTLPVPPAWPKTEDQMAPGDEAATSFDDLQADMATEAPATAPDMPDWPDDVALLPESSLPTLDDAAVFDDFMAETPAGADFDPATMPDWLSDTAPAPKTPPPALDEVDDETLFDDFMTETSSAEPDLEPATMPDWLSDAAPMPEQPSQKWLADEDVDVDDDPFAILDELIDAETDTSDVSSGFTDFLAEVDAQQAERASVGTASDEPEPVPPGWLSGYDMDETMSISPTDSADNAMSKADDLADLRETLTEQEIVDDNFQDVDIFDDPEFLTLADADLDIETINEDAVPSAISEPDTTPPAADDSPDWMAEPEYDFFAPGQNVQVPTRDTREISGTRDVMADTEDEMQPVSPPEWLPAHATLEPQNDAEDVTTPEVADWLNALDEVDETGLEEVPMAADIPGDADDITPDKHTVPDATPYDDQRVAANDEALFAALAGPAIEPASDVPEWLAQAAPESPVEQTPAPQDDTLEALFDAPAAEETSAVLSDWGQTPVAEHVPDNQAKDDETELDWLRAETPQEDWLGALSASDEQEPASVANAPREISPPVADLDALFDAADRSNMQVADAFDVLDAEPEETIEAAEDAAFWDIDESPAEIDTVSDSEVVSMGDFALEAEPTAEDTTIDDWADDMAAWRDTDETPVPALDELPFAIDDDDETSDLLPDDIEEPAIAEESHSEILARLAGRKPAEAPDDGDADITIMLAQPYDPFEEGSEDQVPQYITAQQTGILQPDENPDWMGAFTGEELPPDQEPAEDFDATRLLVEPDDDDDSGATRVLDDETIDELPAPDIDTQEADDLLSEDRDDWKAIEEADGIASTEEVAATFEELDDDADGPMPNWLLAIAESEADKLDPSLAMEPEPDTISLDEEPDAFPPTMEDDWLAAVSETAKTQAEDTLPAEADTTDEAIDLDAALDLFDRDEETDNIPFDAVFETAQDNAMIFAEPEAEVFEFDTFDEAETDDFALFETGDTEVDDLPASALAEPAILSHTREDSPDTVEDAVSDAQDDEDDLAFNFENDDVPDDFGFDEVVPVWLRRPKERDLSDENEVDSQPESASQNPEWLRDVFEEDNDDTEK